MLTVRIENDNAEEGKYFRVEQSFTQDTPLLSVIENFIHALSATGYTRINAEELVNNVVEAVNKK